MGCINFRDVGECLNLLSGQNQFPTRRILRGGKLEEVTSAEEIGNPGTIINLRRGADPNQKLFGADYRHFAISNEQETYHTTDPLVRHWLNKVFAYIAKVERFPILLHCSSGKDRTGIVVAALLHCLEIDRELVVQEYLLSEGDVARSWIETALNGIDDPSGYFRNVDLGRISQKLLGN